MHPTKQFFLAFGLAFLFSQTSFANDPSKFYLRTKTAFNVFLKDCENLEKTITAFHVFLSDQKYPEKENIKYNLRLTFIPETTPLNAFFFCIEDGKTECTWVETKPKNPASLIKHKGWHYEHFLKLIEDVLIRFQKNPSLSKYFNNITSLSFTKSTPEKDAEQRSGILDIRYFDDKNVLGTKRYLCHEAKHEGEAISTPHCH